MMKASQIPGVSIRRLDRQIDARGHFVELMRVREVGAAFAQSNHSRSRQGVLRGLHYHRRQDDLWYFVSGEAQVVLVDLRHPRQPLIEDFMVGQEEPVTFYIPRGVAHGFLALTNVDLVYWVTEEFDSTDEFGIAWNDPRLAVPWMNENPLLSPRDMENKELDWASIPRFS